MLFCKKHKEELLVPIGKTKRLKCRICTREYGAKWWQNNRQTQIKRVRFNSKKNQKACKQFIFDFLQNHPCIKCNETDIEVLEFDHLDSNEKYKDICKLSNSGCTVKKLEKEIKKCQVLCANCHRRKTRQQFGHFRNSMLSSSTG